MKRLFIIINLIAIGMFYTNFSEWELLYKDQQQIKQIQLLTNQTTHGQMVMSAYCDFCDSDVEKEEDEVKESARDIVAFFSIPLQFFQTTKYYLSTQYYTGDLYLLYQILRI